MKQEKGPLCLLRGVWVKSRGGSEPGFVLREARNTESDPSRAWLIRRGEGPLSNSYSVWFWPKAVFGLRESHEGSLPVQSMGQPRWGTKGAAKWRKTLSWGKIFIFSQNMQLLSIENDELLWLCFILLCWHAKSNGRSLRWLCSFQAIAACFALILPKMPPFRWCCNDLKLFCCKKCV